MGVHTWLDTGAANVIARCSMLEVKKLQTNQIMCEGMSDVGTQQLVGSLAPEISNTDCSQKGRGNMEVHVKTLSGVQGLEK